MLDWLVAQVSDSDDYNSDYDEDEDEFSDEGDDFDDQDPEQDQDAGSEDLDDAGAAGSGSGAGGAGGDAGKGRYRGPVPDEFLYRMFAHMFNRKSRVAISRRSLDPLVCSCHPRVRALPAARTDADGDPCECPNCRARGGARPGFRPGYKPK
jgi:hypothetical protein